MFALLCGCLLIYLFLRLLRDRVWLCVNVCTCLLNNLFVCVVGCMFVGVFAWPCLCVFVRSCVCVFVRLVGALVGCLWSSFVL